MFVKQAAYDYEEKVAMEMNMRYIATEDAHPVTAVRKLSNQRRTTPILLSQQQILGTGNLPQDSALVWNNIDISPEMAAQSAQPITPITSE